MSPSTPVPNSQLVQEARQYISSSVRGRGPFPPDRSELTAAQMLIARLADQLETSGAQIDQLTASRGILEFQRDAFHDNLTRMTTAHDDLRAQIQLLAALNNNAPPQDLKRTLAEVDRLRALAHRVLVMAAPVTRVDVYESLRTEIYRGADYVTALVATSPPTRDSTTADQHEPAATDPQPSPSHAETIPCAECARLRPVFEATESYLRAGGAQEVSDVACDLQAAMHTYYRTAPPPHHQGSAHTSPRGDAPTSTRAELAQERLMDVDECRRRYGTDVHPHAGKWRCARCDHIYAPSPKLRRGRLPKCPGCGEAEDVFPADDGGWERAEEDRKSAKKSSRSPWDDV